MTTAAATAPGDAAPSLAGTAWIFLRHLTSLFFPGLALAFIWTGPHRWYVAPLFVAPMVVAFWLDTRPHGERRQPAEELPAWPFDALVLVLAGLQLLVVFELCRLYQHQAIFSVDTLVTLVVVGGSSGFSIITAHELIHRRSRFSQGLGRLLLCTVLYEHFYTEHLRGHHVRVGTPEDPATAHFGESYEGFFRRTVPAQLRSAWRLEKRRLGVGETSPLGRRWLRNRILHGIALGWGMAFAAWVAFGFASFVAFLLQAFMAVRLLEAVNYFEHWGLRRSGARVRPVDSWDTHAWFTYYGLTGLSRHADHHAWPSRPFQQLRVWDEAPILPAGYVGSVDLVMGRNEQFRHHATLELARRGLGPFADGADPALRAEADAALARARRFEAEIAAGSTGERAARAAAGPAGARPRGVRGLWGRLPVPARVGAVLLGIAAAVTLGGWLEAGAGPGLAGRFAVNLWILAVFTGLLALRRRLEERHGRFALSWVAFFALLLVLGSLTRTALA